MSQRISIGKVGAPAPQEASADEFYFCVAPEKLVEQTQLVVCESVIAGQKITFYGVIEEIRRTSRGRSMGAEIDAFDGDLEYEPPFASEGITYARVAVLRAEPPYFTPPRERATVFLAGEDDAKQAYRADEIRDDARLAIGLVRNGGDLSKHAGAGQIDLDYLLGVNGGHLNVNGAAGRGTKSSFLLWINWLLLKKAREDAAARPSDSNRLQIVPVILNVKGFDLFNIDRKSRMFEPEKHGAAWENMGIEAPAPFQNVSYFAPQAKGSNLPVETNGRSDVKPYSWSLKNVLEAGLFEYLFAETDAFDANFSALALDIQAFLTREIVHNDSRVSLAQDTSQGRPTTFKALLEWLREEGGDHSAKFAAHHSATWRKMSRRLVKILHEARGVLRSEGDGVPLDVVRGQTCDPIVVDLNALAGEIELQRFVVAAILKGIIAARTGATRVSGLRYIVTIDELNRFAPKGSRDPVTKLIELVASEMRSQGVILFGAQQQASKVSEKVVENAALRVAGRSGPLELSTVAWRMLSSAAKRKIENLGPGEKMIVQDNFREPMHIQIPFPVWALNTEEALAEVKPNAEGGRDLWN